MSRSEDDVDPKLQSLYDEWDRTGRGIALTELPGSPAAKEDEAVEDTVDPLARLARARAIRQITFLGLAALFAASVWATRADIAYFFASREPVDLGNVRAGYVDGTLPASLPVNALVRAEGMLMTHVAYTDRYNFFLDPLLHVVVRTARPLPDKARFVSVDVDPRWVPIIEDRLAFPQDFTASFEAVGRLLPLSDQPGALRFYERVLRVPPEQAYVLLDGETPGDYLPYFVAQVLTLLAVLVAGVLYVRTRAAERRLLADRQ